MKSERQLVIGELKTYSRKEVRNWVQASQVCLFEELNQGTFFIQLLKKLVPQDMRKQRIYNRPKNVYEFTQNMKLVKKILNKHQLQLNMDVPAIVATKNCFELANWFKNLYEKNAGDIEYVFERKPLTPMKAATSMLSPVKNSKMMRAASSDFRRSNKNLPILMSISSAQFQPSPAGRIQLVGKDRLPPPYKTQNTINSKCDRKSYMFNDVGSNFNEIHQKSSPSHRASRQKLTKTTVPMLNFMSQKTMFQNSHTKINQQEIVYSSGDSQVMNLMKKQAIKQNIQTFQTILAKVQAYVQSIGQGDAPENIQEMRSKISDIIYMKS